MTIDMSPDVQNNVTVESLPKFIVPDYEEPEGAEAWLAGIWREDGTGEAEPAAPDDAVSSSAAASDSESDEGNEGGAGSNASASSSSSASSSGSEAPVAPAAPAQEAPAVAPPAVPAAPPAVPAAPASPPVADKSTIRTWMRSAMRKQKLDEAHRYLLGAARGCALVRGFTVPEQLVQEVWWEFFI